MANCGFLSYETVGIYAPCSTKNIQFWKGNKGDVTQETVSIQRSHECSLQYCTHFTSRTALPLSRNEGMEKQVAQTCFLWAGRENCFFQKQCDFVWFIKQEVLLWYRFHVTLSVGTELRNRPKILRISHGKPLKERIFRYTDGTDLRCCSTGIEQHIFDLFDSLTQAIQRESLLTEVIHLSYLTSPG